MISQSDVHTQLQLAQLTASALTTAIERAAVMVATSEDYQVTANIAHFSADHIRSTIADLTRYADALDPR